MGKWCHVRCECFGGAPVNESHSKVQICSHEEGVLVQGWPYHLFEIGWTIRDLRGEPAAPPGLSWQHPLPERMRSARAAYPTGTFRLFRRFSPILFVEEYLVFTVEEAAEWRGEIEAIAAAMDGRCPPELDRAEVIALDAKLRARAHGGSASMPIESFYGGAPDTRRYDSDSEYTHLLALNQSLDFGLRLCDASLRSGKPIEFFW